VLNNDSDPDSDSLTIYSVTQGTNGSVAINGSDVIYTPDDNYHGNDSFTYTINDGRGGTDTATVFVTLSSVEDAPVAVDDTAATDVDTPVDVLVLENDSDGDNDPLTITSVTQPTIASVPTGSVVNHGTYVTFTPDGAGTYTFDYTIGDGKGGSDTATVTMTVSEVSTNTPLYVYDISFVPHARKGDWWQAVFEIHADTNGNGAGDDSGVAGVEITVVFAGQTFTGTTDSNGMFTTGWVKKLQTNTEYYANVVDMALAGYNWDPLALDLEDDSDEDGNPDARLWFE
jgi:hypothetical protein